MLIQKTLNKLNLKNRILIPVNLVSIFLLLSLLLGTYIYQSTSSAMKIQLKSKVGFISDFLVESSKVYIQNWDLAALENFTKVAVKDADIDYAVFLDPKDKPLTETSKFMCR